MEPLILRGAAPDGDGYGSGYGDGYGYGDGDGSGYGDGYGYGYGYGSGSGSGDGDGYGSGSGSGYGDGSGSGDGDGDGYGYGDGDGDGYGYGDGSGYGYGDGDGSGDGYGSGDGSGSKEYWSGTIPHFAERWTDPQQSRLRELQSAGATIAFWRSTKAGKPANGGVGKAVKAGDIQTETGPLSLCHAGTLHATLLPTKWKGDRWWIVALTGEVVSDDDKFGALSREIIGEAIFDAE